MSLFKNEWPNTTFLSGSPVWHSDLHLHATGDSSMVAKNGVDMGSFESVE